MNKDDLSKLIIQSGKPVAVENDMAVEMFGFVRITTQEALFAKLLMPSKTEKELSTLPRHKMTENIEQFAKENNFRYQYDFHYDRHIFSI